MEKLKLSKIAKKRSRELLDKMRRLKILVVGDIILDEFIWGKASRISPEAPVPIVNVTRETKRLGGAANVANNLLALGCNVGVTSPVGQDIFGEQLIEILRENGIAAEGIFATTDRPTPIKTRIIAGQQQIVRFDREQVFPLSGKITAKILKFITEKAPELDAVIISDYGKGTIGGELVNTIVKLAAKSGLLVAVDPKVENFQLYKKVDLITPNTSETINSVGIDIRDEKSLMRAGKKVLSELRCRMALITRGEEGMSLFEKGQPPIHIKTAAREVYDVTGAGDTVIATMTAALAAGATSAEAAIIANAAAGVVVGELGTSPIQHQKLKVALKQR
jgi:D-glycero-beta-D-manno-heptose-7-phosphate kinase